MKKYTSDEVIDLVRQYFEQDEDCINPNESIGMFIDWLKVKEQSELPIKGQTIWVRDILNSLSLPTTWIKGKFIEFTSRGIYTEMENGSLLTWDEYSLTDPTNG